MYNERLISAALIQLGNPDAGASKRGAVKLFQIFVPTFFADEMTNFWPADSARNCQPFAIQGTPHEALPIDMPVAPGQVGDIKFDFGTFKFYVLKPTSPMDNPFSGQLAAEYRIGGATVRDFVALDVIHASTIMNIITRMLGLAPGGYKADFDDLMNRMAQIGEEHSKMFT